MNKLKEHIIKNRSDFLHLQMDLREASSEVEKMKIQKGCPELNSIGGKLQCMYTSKMTDLMQLQVSFYNIFLWETRPSKDEKEIGKFSSNITRKWRCSLKARGKLLFLRMYGIWDYMGIFRIYWALWDFLSFLEKCTGFFRRKKHQRFKDLYHHTWWKSWILSPSYNDQDSSILLSPLK